MRDRVINYHGNIARIHNLYICNGYDVALRVQLQTGPETGTYKITSAAHLEQLGVAVRPSFVSQSEKSDAVLALLEDYFPLPYDSTYIIELGETVYSEMKFRFKDLLSKLISIKIDPIIPAYPNGTIVYNVVSGKIREDKGVGKVLTSSLGSNGYFNYEVEFINYGMSVEPHHKLVPTRDHFGFVTSTTPHYESTFDFGKLYPKGTKFILIGDYLHNNGSNLILLYEKFKDKFTKINV